MSLLDLAQGPTLRVREESAQGLRELGLASLPASKALPRLLDAALELALVRGAVKVAARFGVAISIKAQETSRRSSDSGRAPTISSISSSLRRKSIAPTKPSTCPGLRAPTRAPVPAESRSVHAIATSPAERP